jgi:hypothetical protein
LDADPHVIVGQRLLVAVEHRGAGHTLALEAADEGDVDRLAGFVLKLVHGDERAALVLRAIHHEGEKARVADVLVEVGRLPNLLLRSGGEHNFCHLILSED